jgi:hypothetical protein
MKTFTNWLISEMGGVPVHLLGQKAENTLHYLLDLMKPLRPGAKLTVIFTVPTSPHGKPLGEHTYSNTIEITEDGQWVITSNNQFAGSDKQHSGGPWFGEKNAISVLHSAVGSAYYHGGKIWAVTADGQKELVKDSSSSDPTGPASLVNPLNPNPCRPKNPAEKHSSLWTCRSPRRSL